MKKQKGVFGFLVVGIFLVLLSSFVLASGVSSPYYAGNPLYMEPGTTQTVTLTLQNAAGEAQDITFDAVIDAGSEIASLDSSSYDVPFGSKVNAIATITIPENPSVDKYTVTFTFTQSPKDSGQQVQVGTSVSTTFDVLVQKNLPPQEDTTTVNIGEAPKSGSNLTTILILAGLVVLAIIIYLSSKKGKGKKKK